MTGRRLLTEGDYRALSAAMLQRQRITLAAGRDGEIGGQELNTALIWTMAVTSFIVTIMGGVLLAVLLFYGMYRLIASVWERASNVARNTKEYMRNRDDFELYKRDIEIWDEEKRRYIEKCSACGYRKEAMGGADHEC